MGETPLEYLLRLINDPTADPRRRDRAAVAAAPFCHAKPAPVGQKRQQAEAAERAGVATEWASDLDVDADGRLRQ